MEIAETHDKSALTPTGSNDTIVTKLQELKGLLDEGLITQNDYNKKKEELLSKL